MLVQRAAVHWREVHSSARGLRIYRAHSGRHVSRLQALQNTAACRSSRARLRHRCDPRAAARARAPRPSMPAPSATASADNGARRADLRHSPSMWRVIARRRVPAATSRSAYAAMRSSSLLGGRAAPGVPVTARRAARRARAGGDRPRGRASRRPTRPAPAGHCAAVRRPPLTPTAQLREITLEPLHHLEAQRRHLAILARREPAEHRFARVHDEMPAARAHDRGREGAAAAHSHSLRTRPAAARAPARHHADAHLHASPECSPPRASPRPHSATRAGSSIRQAPKAPACTRSLGQPQFRLISS